VLSRAVAGVGLVSKWGRRWRCGDPRVRGGRCCWDMTPSPPSFDLNKSGAVETLPGRRSCVGDAQGMPFGAVGCQGADRWAGKPPNGARRSSSRGRVFRAIRPTPALWRSACRGRAVGTQRPPRFMPRKNAGAASRSTVGLTLPRSGPGRRNWDDSCPPGGTHPDREAVCNCALMGWLLHTRLLLAAGVVALLPLVSLLR
jgi:hypothetical protein